MEEFRISAMEPQKKKRKFRLYIPWYTHDQELYDEEEGEEDSWVNYLRRNLSHPLGIESPFPDSSWSYATGGSYFDHEDERENEKFETSDQGIHDNVLKAFYENELIDASNIRVVVLNGIVCLFGTVKRFVEKKEAERVSARIPGVWSVRNEITIEEVQ